MKYTHFKLLILLLITSGTLYSQNKEEKLKNKHLIFTESKILDEHFKVVYFCLSEVRDQDHQLEIQKALSDLSEVKKVRIYLDLNHDYRCQMTVFRDVSPLDIQKTLKQVQTDFLYKSVKEDFNKENNNQTK